MMQLLQSFMTSGPPPAPAEAALGARPLHERTGEPLRALIVEDEALIALDLQTALSEFGFDVVGTADTEADAVAMAAELAPDIVLMDIRLRDGDGVAAASAIAADRLTCIVFVSGNIDPSTWARAQTIAAGFIQKPYDSTRMPAQVLGAYRKFSSEGRA